MALKFIEGFGSYSTVAQVERKWSSSSNIGDSFFENGRTPTLGNSLGFNGTSLMTRNLGSHATWVVGFAFMNINLARTSVDTIPILDIMDGTTSQLTLVLDVATGFLSVVRNATTLGTGTTTIVPGVWYYLELKTVINNSTGTVTLKINTTSEIALTGQDTQESGAAQANIIRFNSSAAATTASGRYRLDDVYICDGSGSTNNDFLGDMKVETLTPTGAGGSTEWSPSAGYTNWEGALTADGIFNFATGSDKIDMFTVSPLTKITTIKGLAINMTVRNSDSTGHNIRSVVSSAETTENLDGSNTAVDSTAYVTHSIIRETDPDTATAWDVAGINAAEFGIKLV